MCKRCMKAIAVLAVLVISLISVSSAAGPRAMPDLYTGQCGVELSVPAPGILANDVKSANPLQVLDPDTISIDPKYGKLTVNKDGSFSYDVAQNVASGTYVTFKYKATDGSKTTSQALVKIQIFCACRGTAPDVTVCPGTMITPNFLIAEGALCTGCRDAMPRFDLSKIPARPEAGACYPYFVSCPSCVRIAGNVCFSDSCTITSTPNTVCSDAIPTIEMIEANGEVSCGDCDSTLDISDLHIVGNHWEYTITCTTDDCTTTETGIVNIEQRCGFVSEPMGFTNPIENCPDVLPTKDQIIASAGLECTCGPTFKIIDIKWIGMDENGMLIGEYTATCGTEECGSSFTGQFEARMDCDQ
jgi:hypothetical protein